MTVKNNILSNNERYGDFDLVSVFSYSDIADNVSTGVTIGKIPANGGVEMAVVVESVALAGTDVDDITLDVGTTSADPDEFIDGLDVDGMSAPVANTGDAFTGNQNQPVGLTATAKDILAEFNGNTAGLTAGEVVIGIKLVDLGRFATATNS